jgi:hypothetical protein
LQSLQTIFGACAGVLPQKSRVDAWVRFQTESRSMNFCQPPLIVFTRFYAVNSLGKPMIDRTEAFAQRLPTLLRSHIQ